MHWPETVMLVPKLNEVLLGYFDPVHTMFIVKWILSGVACPIYPPKHNHQCGVLSMHQVDPWHVCNLYTFYFQLLLHALLLLDSTIHNVSLNHPEHCLFVIFKKTCWRFAWDQCPSPRTVGFQDTCNALCLNWDKAIIREQIPMGITQHQRKYIYICKTIAL